MSRKRKAREQPPFEVTLEGFDDQGRAVARIDGKVVFVSGALPGERVTARYLAFRRRYDEAEVIEVLEPHPNRTEPRCAHHDMCGGCVLQHLEHDAQVALKQERLLDNLKRVGGVVPEQVLAPIVAEPWGYRSRARLGVKYVPAKGGALVGFRERSGHRLADIHHCPVLDPRVGEQIDTMRAVFTSLECRARLPQIEVALGETEGALAMRHLDDLSEDDERALVALGGELGLSMAGQSGGPDTISTLGGAAPAELHYQLPDFDIDMTFGIADFTQVNQVINRAMVTQAMDLLAPQADETVLDLFCGIGNFTLPIARRAGRVTGVEASAGAIERARQNARQNDIDSATFSVADLFDPEAAAVWAKTSCDAMLIDPPRSGAAAIVEALPRKGGPRRIVYVSCSPATLARDAAHLCGVLGYKLRSAGIVDMFPHTNHVESMALFERG